MKTLGAIGASTLLACSWGGQVVQAAKPKADAKPNILYIMTDQQSWKMLSCTGNPWLRTPAMDAIAQSGYRFDRAYCVNPVSVPSRFALMTGHYGSEVGLRFNTAPFDQEKLADIYEQGTLGRVFRAAGYQTQYVGKVHIPGGGRYKPAERMDKELGFTMLSPDDRMEGAQAAADWIAKQGDSDQPFFMFLSLINPHDICYLFGSTGTEATRPPRVPEGEWESVKAIRRQQNAMPEALYRSQTPPLPANFAPAEPMPEQDAPQKGVPPERYGFYSWCYHRLTETADSEIAVVLKALESSPLKDNTIIVFTSDHGEMNGEHGLVMKSRFYDPSTRIPFIFSGPGIKKGVVDDNSLVCNGQDLFPTLCDLAGVTPPQGLTGISLKPTLTGKGEQQKRPYLVTESIQGFMIQDDRYKYALYDGPEVNQLLVDLQTDPGETRNLAYDPAHQSTRDRLASELKKWMDARGLQQSPNLLTKGGK